MRKPIAIDPAVRVTYWMGTLYDSAERGDAIMADAACRELYRLGFDVQPASPRRRRRPRAAAAAAAN